MTKEHQKLVEDRIADIKANPTKHQHTFDGLQRCCIIGGVLDTSVLVAHETFASTGINGSKACDVTEGPCSCGATH